MKYTFPVGYGERCYLVPIDGALVPLVAGALRKFLESAVWETREDYELGYNAVGELLANMTNNCATELIESSNRLYRLLDTALNGQIYTAPTSDPADITPAIPLVPSDEIGELPGLRRQLLDLQGELPAGFLGLFPRPATLADLVAALRQGSEEEGQNLLDRLDLLGDVGDAAGIFNVVRGSVTDALEVGAEGGVLATLVVSTAGQAAMGAIIETRLITLAEKLDRLIEQMGVPATPLPSATIAGELGQVRELLTPEEVV
jgi:hypothetical protein